MSVRQKVDKFFNDSSKKSAGKELDHDGMLDEQMESMLKPTGTKIEMGKRRLGEGANDLNLHGKAYESKKVSRAALEQ